MQALMVVISLIYFLIGMGGPALSAELRGGGLVLPAQQVASSGGTKILTLDDQQVIEVTGTATHTVQLPDAVDVGPGWFVYVLNSSENVAGISVTDDSGSLIAKLDNGQTGFYQLMSAATPQGRWSRNKLSATGGGGGGMDLTALSADAPLEYNNVTGKFKMNPASGSANGYLSSADFATFAAKLTSPLSTKGDVLTHDGANHARLGAGSDGELLTADSSLPLGLKWAPAPVSLPTQTGQSGKYLTTNGTTASWAAVMAGLQYSDFSASAPMSYNGAGQFSMAQASSGMNGYLSSTDWSLFNAKQAAGNYLTALTGDVVATGPGSAASTIQPNAVTTAKILDANVTTAKIADANITLAKMATGSVSGDKLTVGAVDLADTKVTGVTPIVKGGTGAGTAQGAINNLSGLTTKGQVLSHDGTNVTAFPGPAPGEAIIGNPFAVTGLDTSPMANADMVRAAIAASVSSNVITISLKALNGGAILPQSPAAISFRRANPIDGGVQIRTITDQPTLTIPALATLGLVNKTGYIYVYALDNAGSVVLAASGSQLPDTELQSAPAIGTGATATNPSVMYAMLPQVTLPSRLLGRVQIATDSSGNTSVVKVDTFPTKQTQAAQFTTGGGMLVGGATFSDQCYWSTNSTSLTDYAADSTCVITPFGGASAPSTNIPGVTIPTMEAGEYLVVYSGSLESARQGGAGTTVNYRVSDGTNYSRESVAVNAQTQADNANARNTGGTWSMNYGAKQSNVTLRIQGQTVTPAGSLAGVNAVLAGTAGSIRVYYFPEKSKLAATLITKDPVTNFSGLLTTKVTGRDPSVIGEYRYMQRAAASQTYSDSGALPIQPTAANGIPLWRGNGYNTADSLPTRLDVFIGQNKQYAVRAWAQSSGVKGDAIEITPFTVNSSYDVGWSTIYDPNTGVLSFVRFNDTSNTGSHYIGRPRLGGMSSANYALLEISTFDNPLAAGMTTVENGSYAFGAIGHGSTGTKIRRLLNITNKGTASTCVDSATAGMSCTINEDGDYRIFFQDRRNAGTTELGISRNQSSLTTNMSGLSDSERAAWSLANTNGTYGNVSWNGVLRKGEVIRVGGDGSSDNNSNGVQFQLVKTPSPLENVGAAGGSGNVNSLGGSERIERASVNSGTIGSSCTSSPCAVSQSGSWLASATRSGAGLYSLNIAAGVFASPPTCVYSLQGGQYTLTNAQSNSATLATVTTASTAGTPSDASFNVICMGPRGSN